MEKNILIVDDSASQRLKLKHDLEQNGYSVIDAVDAEAAMLEIKMSKPDLVISDVIMPGMDGYEFCKKLKNGEETKDIPVILLTSLSEPEDVIKGLESKTDNFITKPYEKTELLKRIQYVLMNDEIRNTNHGSSIGIDIFFGGKKHTITAERVQILDLLFSTFENSLKQNEELRLANKKLKELSVELKQKNETLEILNEDKNRFLRIAAHDIRNPADAILQSQAMLREEIDHMLDEDQKELFTIFEQAPEAILQLLNEILDIAVLEASEVELQFTETDIVNVISKIVLFNSSIAHSKNIKLETDGLPEKLVINIDRVKIEQVLNNLVSNAIKYSEENTKVTLSINDTPDALVFCVEDQGLGIPKDQQEKLFKPFSTAGVKATRGERSTGLGLSIVKKIIEKHHGEIWFESTVKVGSKFYFSLPRSL